MRKHLVCILALFLVFGTALSASDRVGNGKIRKHYGTVTSVDATAQTLTVKQGDVVTTFTITESTKVYIPHGKAALEDLKDGDEVEILYEEKRGKRVATKIAFDTTDDGPACALDEHRCNKHECCKDKDR